MLYFIKHSLSRLRSLATVNRSKPLSSDEDDYDSEAPPTDNDSKRNDKKQNDNKRNDIKRKGPATDIRQASDSRRSTAIRSTWTAIPPYMKCQAACLVFVVLFAFVVLFGVIGLAISHVRSVHAIYTLDGGPPAKIEFGLWHDHDLNAINFTQVLKKFYKITGLKPACVKLVRRAVWSAEVGGYVYFEHDHILRNNDTFRLQLESIGDCEYVAFAHFIHTSRSRTHTSDAGNGEGEVIPEDMYAAGVAPDKQRNFDEFLRSCFRALGLRADEERVLDVTLRKRNGTAVERRFDVREKVLENDEFVIRLNKTSEVPAHGADITP